MSIWRSKFIVPWAGPGLIESVYEEALAWELSQAGRNVLRQEPTPIRYKGLLLASPLKIDLLVDNLVIIECKATEARPPNED